MAIIKQKDIPNIIDIVHSYYIASFSIADCFERSANSWPRYKAPLMKMSNLLRKGVSIENALIQTRLFPVHINNIITSGHSAGKLSEVLENIVSSVTFINESSSKIRGSLMMNTVTLAATLVALPYLLMFISGQVKHDGLVKTIGTTLTSWLDAFPLLMALYPSLVVGGFLFLFVNPKAQQGLIKTVAIIPYVKKAVDHWQLGQWAKNISLLVDAGINYIDAEKMLRPNLNLLYRAAITRISDEMIISGWAKATDSKTGNWKRDDIRRTLPRLLRAYILSGAESGSMGQQLNKISERFLIDARKRFEVIAAYAFYLVLLITAGLVVFMAISMIQSRGM